MSIKVQKNNLLINQSEITKTEVCSIEGDCIVPDVKPDIVNIIYTSGVICIHKKEILDGKIRMDGAINTYIMYNGTEGEKEIVRGINHTLDFSQVFAIDNANSEMNDIGKVTLQGIEGKIINERKIGIRAKVKFEIKLQNNRSVEYIEDVKLENIQKLEKDISAKSIIGIGGTKTSINETIKLKNEDKLSEILRVDTNFCNTETKVSYNKVLIKSEVDVKVLYSTDDGRFDVVQSRFPIMGFIEMKDLSDDCTITPSVVISNFTLNSNGSQDGEITVDIELEIGAVVYNNVKIKIIEDMYCPSKCLKIEKKTIKMLKDCTEYRDIYHFNQKELIDLGDEKIYSTNSSVIVNKIKVHKNVVLINGNIRISIIHSTNKITKINNRYLDIPFEYKMNCDGINETDNIDICTDVKFVSINTSQGGELEIKMDIEFIINSCNLMSVDLVENVEEEERSSINNHNIVVYYTKNSDKLWNIAKEFGSTMDNIIKDNKLEGEIIQEGTQLFITKD